MDIRQSKPYADYLRKINWQVLLLEFGSKKVQIFWKKIPFLGSFFKIQRSNFLPSSKTLDLALRKYHPQIVKIEADYQTPQAILGKYRDFGYQVDKKPSLPTKTIWIDAEKPDNIWQQLPKKTRYQIRKARENNLRLEIVPPDKRLGVIDLFGNFWQKQARKRGFFLSLKKEITVLWEAFSQEAFLALVFEKKEIVAGALLLHHQYGNTLNYMYAASDQRGRKKLANYLIIWEGIKLAAELGCKIFDLEGVYDERYPDLNKSWKGFSHFKKSFGGREIFYPRPLVKINNLMLKLLDRI